MPLLTPHHMATQKYKVVAEKTFTKNGKTYKTHYPLGRIGATVVLTDTEALQCWDIIRPVDKALAAQWDGMVKTKQKPRVIRGGDPYEQSLNELAARQEAEYRGGGREGAAKTAREQAGLAQAPTAQQQGVTMPVSKADLEAGHKRKSEKVEVLDAPEDPETGETIEITVGAGGKVENVDVLDSELHEKLREYSTAAEIRKAFDGEELQAFAKELGITLTKKDGSIKAAQTLARDIKKVVNG